MVRGVPFQDENTKMKLTKVTRYYPEEKPYGDEVQYFIDENGLDFYTSFPMFTKKYKLCVHPESKFICSVATDISKLYPAGFDIIETDILPEDIMIRDKYQYINEQIITKEYSSSDLENIFLKEKENLLKVASEIILPLQDAVDLDMATEEEIVYLSRLKKYRVQLNRTSFDIKSDVNWPIMPHNY